MGTLCREFFGWSVGFCLEGLFLWLPGGVWAVAERRALMDIRESWTSSSSIKFLYLCIFERVS